ANIVDSPEKYEYLMKCLNEAKEKLNDALSWGANPVSDSTANPVSDSTAPTLLPPSQGRRGRGRPPKRKKSIVEKVMEKQNKKNKKNVFLH
ncbi:hypothetical protein Tco_0495399, partial [Tanacetum coccineum]